MGQTARQDSASRQQPKRAAAEGFKPLALPALAAAVEMSRRDSRPTTRERDVPAFLRELALTD